MADEHKPYQPGDIADSTEAFGTVEVTDVFVSVLTGRAIYEVKECKGERPMTLLARPEELDRRF